MVLYFAKWTVDQTLAKGKGRTSTKDFSCGCTVICRNSHDALRCLDFHFRYEFSKVNKHDYTFDDGTTFLSRMKIDSRNFNAMYLLLDGMKEPMYLTDPGSNVLRAKKIFGSAYDI